MWLVYLRNWTFDYFLILINLKLNSHTWLLTPILDSAGLKYVILLLVSVLTLKNGTYCDIKTGHGIYKYNLFFTPWATGNIFKDQDNNCVCIFDKRWWTNVLDLSVWADYKLIFIYVLNPISGEDIFLSPVLCYCCCVSQRDCILI